MPVMTAVTLNGVSGADHVFSPFGIDPKGVAKWVKPGTTPVGDETMTFSMNRTPSGKFRALLKIVVPKTQDVDVGGVTRPTVVKTGIVTVEFTSDSAHTAVERGELLDLVRSALSDADFDEIPVAVVNNQAFW